MWNMQSGAHRKSFNIGPCPEGVHTKYRRPPGKQRSEERTVTGLATDSLNRVAIASTLDGTVNVRVHAIAVKEPKLQIYSQKVF
jgi:U3 small nucleolar RNA-associated protein 21